jgi:hypothetical protein
VPVRSLPTSQLVLASTDVWLSVLSVPLAGSVCPLGWEKWRDRSPARHELSRQGVPVCSGTSLMSAPPRWLRGWRGKTGSPVPLRCRQG